MGCGFKKMQKTGAIQAQGVPTKLKAGVVAPHICHWWFLPLVVRVTWVLAVVS